MDQAALGSLQVDSRSVSGVFSTMKGTTKALGSEAHLAMATVP
jgi:hypothetical protein